MTELSRRRDLLIYLGLTMAILVVYWPVSHFKFINYDDNAWITENPYVRGGLTLRGVGWAFTNFTYDHWMPLTWLVRMLECQLFGLNSGAHHLVNVLLHIANTLLLFSLLNSMTRAPWRSGFVAALFALHPLHVESVAWVTELKDMLSTCLWMTTICAYVSYVRRLNIHSFSSRVFYGLALTSFALGLMAKPMVVTLPFVLLLLDYWPLGRTRWVKLPISEVKQRPLSQLVKEKLPFLALTVVSSVVTFRAQRVAGAIVSVADVSIGDRLANAVVSYSSYIGKAFWPSRTALFYPYQTWPLSTVISAAVVLIGISSAVVWLAKRHPHFIVGWLWYLGVLAPVIGFVQVGNQAMADRYTYLPSIGLFIMVAWSIPKSLLSQRVVKSIASTTAVALLSLCAALCWRQVGYWRNSETLFRHSLEVTKANWLAHNNLGKALLDNGRVQESIGHFEQAVAIKPDYAVAHDNLGSALAQEGRLQEAAEQFDLALRIQPSLADAHYNMGRALLQMNRLPEAITHYKQAAQLNPYDVDAQFELGNALMALGNVQEAIKRWEKVVRLKPDHVEARNNLGAVLAQTGKFPEAAEEFNQVLRITPDDVEVRCNLGNVLLASGKLREAINQYDQVLRVNPDNPAALNSLARLLATMPAIDGGDPVRAVGLAERACQLTGYRVAPYLDTLAAAYAAAGRFNDAVATAQKAVELGRAAGQSELAAEIERRLKLYREGYSYRRPVHETSPTQP
jgi:protein O-mannosyl-transferase